MQFQIPSSDSIERAVFIMYASGGVVQLYILCSCVQQLLDAVSMIECGKLYKFYIIEKL